MNRRIQTLPRTCDSWHNDIPSYFRDPFRSLETLKGPEAWRMCYGREGKKERNKQTKKQRLLGDLVRVCFRGYQSGVVHLARLHRCR